MKFTLSWLKDHLNTVADLDTIAHTLTMSGLEVEKIVNPLDILDGFIIAEITHAEQHPNADRLKVCTVNSGTEQLQIVCGASNAKTGIKVVLAPVGLYIPGGDFTLKKGNIRGVDSCGMMCSYPELGIEGDADSIIELSADAPVGESYAIWAGLDDPIIEIAITPNRGDCLGVRGIARDLSASGIGTLKTCPYDNINTETGDISPITWDIKTPHAPHVMGRLFTGVKNVPSPAWLQNRLNAIGIAPRTALVDITNYVSYELGRPLHVFDADKIGTVLTIRPAQNGEKIHALNDCEYTLDDTMTVIADEKHIHSIGGVMGGMACSVTEDTTNVFVESAWFDPVNIAKTGRKLDILSDARYRFERTVNPLSNTVGIKSASKLILELCGGTAYTITTAGTPRFEHKKVTLRLSALKQKSGIVIPPDVAVVILEALGFEPTYQNDVISCTVPPARPDITGEHCLIEEVLRIYGFDKIPPTPLPKYTAVSKNILTPLQKRIGIARRALASTGYNEAVTFAFMADTHARIFAPAGILPEMMLKNPISADLNTMRPSILPNLLGAYNRNKSRGNADVALFEVGGTYFGNTPDSQINCISGIRAGKTHARHWAGDARSVDVFDAKADAYTVLQALGINTDTIQVVSTAPSYYHPGQSAVMKLGKFVLGSFGTLHPKAMKTLGIKGTAVGFEIPLNNLPPIRQKGKTRPQFKVANLQSVQRDFAFEVMQNIPSATILKSANVDKKLIADIRVFDVFIGGTIAKGYKSVAVQVTLQPQKQTMTDIEIENISKKITASVLKATGGSVR